MLRASKILFIFIAIITATSAAFAQVDSVNAARNAVQAGNLPRALSAINAAVANPATANDAEAWYIKGFVLNEMAKKLDGDKASNTRIESFEAIKKSIQYDTKKEVFSQDSLKLKYLSSKFNNDAASNLNGQNYEKAIKYYDKYKECLKLMNPKQDVKDKEIYFSLALATVFTSAYESNRKDNEAFFQKAVETYKTILSIDPENISANYSLGILYYNKAVAIITEINFDETDIIKLSETQDLTIEIFKQSLPFMEKAYQLNPKRKETLIGLEGIYYSLNETDKLNKIKSELEILNK